MDIEITVDGKPIERNRFCNPVMSLHRADAGYSSKPFELRIATRDLVTVTARPYARFVAEMKEDDEITGDPVPALLEAGYPATITELLQHAAALDVVMGTYLIGDFLNAIQPEDTEQPTCWYATSMGESQRTRCALEGDTVIFSGLCICRGRD